MMACYSALVCAATNLASACKVTADVFWFGTQRLARSMIRDTCLSDVLPVIPVPCASNRKVFNDGVSFSCKSSLSLPVPVRVYRVPHANKTLRGLGVRGIGKVHVLRVSLMKIEGIVNFLESGEVRLKVSDHARAGTGGHTHFVKGWIDKEGLG